MPQFLHRLTVHEIGSVSLDNPDSPVRAAFSKECGHVAIAASEDLPYFLTGDGKDRQQGQQKDGRVMYFRSHSFVQLLQFEYYFHQGTAGQDGRCRFVVPVQTSRVYQTDTQLVLEC